MREDYTVENTYAVTRREPTFITMEHGIRAKIVVDCEPMKIFVPNRLVNKFLGAELPAKMHIRSEHVKLRTTGHFVRNILREVLT